MKKNGRHYTFICEDARILHCYDWELYTDSLHQHGEQFVTEETLLSIAKPTRCTVSQIYFIFEQHSTCFGRSLRPSSGV